MPLIPNAAVGSGGLGVCGGQVSCIGGIPNIISLSPSTVVAGTGGFTLTVIGSNFRSDSIVSFDGSDRVTTFINSTQLTAEILGADILADGSFAIVVTNPPPGCGPSNPVNLTVTPAPPGEPAFRFVVVGYL